MISVFSRKENCYGCAACNSICPTNAIEMKPDNEGFLYPNIIKESCINCGLCQKVCPFKELTHSSDKLPNPLVYAVKHKDDHVRMNSTSGGVYTALSDVVIRSSGKVYGVKFDNEVNVIHSEAITFEERNKFRGSKYVQSDMKDVFHIIKKQLKSNCIVFFTGTPCQVAAVVKYINQIGLKSDRLITNDIVCHGVSSPLLWSNYLEFIERDKKLKSYTFRYKEKGWRGYNIKAEFVNGKSKINTPDIKIYSYIYSSNLALRPSCYYCKFANLKRPSDITIGDFWGIEKIMPEIDDDKGVSLVLINTSKGKEIFEKAMNDLEVWKSNVYDCLQPNLIRPTERPDKREQFWRDYYEKGFKYIAKKYGGYNFKSIIKKYIREIIKIRLIYEKH